MLWNKLLGDSGAGLKMFGHPGSIHSAALELHGRDPASPAIPVRDEQVFTTLLTLRSPARSGCWSSTTGWRCGRRAGFRAPSGWTSCRPVSTSFAIPRCTTSFMAFQRSADLGVPVEPEAFLQGLQGVVAGGEVGDAGGLVRGWPPSPRDRRGRNHVTPVLMPGARGMRLLPERRGRSRPHVRRTAPEERGRCAQAPRPWRRDPCSA